MLNCLRFQKKSLWNFLDNDFELNKRRNFWALLCYILLRERFEPGLIMCCSARLFSVICRGQLQPTFRVFRNWRGSLHNEFRRPKKYNVKLGWDLSAQLVLLELNSHSRIEMWQRRDVTKSSIILFEFHPHEFLFDWVILYACNMTFWKLFHCRSLSEPNLMGNV